MDAKDREEARFLRLGTFNVHNPWSDRVLRDISVLLHKHNVDIVGLQEITQHSAEQLCTFMSQGRGTTPWYFAHRTADHCGNATLSRFPILWSEGFPLQGQEVIKHDNYHGEMRSAILTKVDTPIGVLCHATTHLDHVHEERRLNQFQALHHRLQLYFNSPFPKPLLLPSTTTATSSSSLLASSFSSSASSTSPFSLSYDSQTPSTPSSKSVPAFPNQLPGHILVGDFNALTRADYSTIEWDEITRVRSDSRWPNPVSTLMDILLPRFYVHDAASFPAPITAPPTEIEAPRYSTRSKPFVTKGTCRFNTRIDYILASADRPQEQKEESLNYTFRDYRVVPVTAEMSDHCLVLVDLVEVPYDEPNRKKCARTLQSTTLDHELDTQKQCEVNT